MRKHTTATRILAIFAVATLAITGCADDEETPDNTDTTSDTTTGDTGGGDTMAGDTMAGDTMAGDTMAGDTMAGDTMTGDTGPEDTMTGDTMAGDTMTGDTMTGDTMTGDVMDGPYDLTFSGTGFNPHDGGVFGVAVVRDSDGVVLGFDEEFEVFGGSFTGTWVDLLDAGETYTIYYYADLSGDGLCDAPPTDHGWSETVAAVAGDVTVEVVHNTDFDADVCTFFPNTFDLTFEGTGYDPHNGQLFEIALVDNATQEVVARDDTVVIADGTFSVTWEDVLAKNQTYTLLYYVDLNVSGECDTPPTDHGWADEIAAVTDDVLAISVHDTDFEATVCDWFVPVVHDLTFTGTGYTPHIGQLFEVALYNNTTGMVDATDTVTIDADTFTTTWEGLLADGVDYSVYYYADLNGNLACNPEPVDHGWKDDLGVVTAPVQLDTTHNVNFDATVCDHFTPSYSLTFGGTAYEPHDGQTLYVVVVRDSDSEVVVPAESVTVAAGAFSFTWDGLLSANEAYTIYWYADMNGNSSCEVPPLGDHAWSTAVAAPTADVAITETHNTNFDLTACLQF